MTLNNLRGWAWARVRPVGHGVSRTPFWALCTMCKIIGTYCIDRSTICLQSSKTCAAQVQGWFYLIVWTVELLSTRINVPKQDEVTLKGYICTFVYCICTHTHMYENIYLSKFTFGPSSPCILCANQIYDRVSLKGGLERKVRAPTNVSMHIW